MLYNYVNYFDLAMNNKPPQVLLAKFPASFPTKSIKKTKNLPAKAHRSIGKRPKSILKKRKRTSNQLPRLPKTLSFSQDIKSHPSKSLAVPQEVWLSPNDYQAIQEDAQNVLSTYESTPLQQRDQLDKNSFCFRGLENYQSTIQCWKPEVSRRRQALYKVVKDEQESQKHQKQNDNKISSSSSNNNNAAVTTTSTTHQATAESQFRWDVDSIRSACLFRSNRENAMGGIEKGLSDQQAARAVHRESKALRQTTNFQQRLLLNFQNQQQQQRSPSPRGE